MGFILAQALKPQEYALGLLHRKAQEVF